MRASAQGLHIPASLRSCRKMGRLPHRCGCTLLSTSSLLLLLLLAAAAAAAAAAAEQHSVIVEYAEAAVARAAIAGVGASATTGKAASAGGAAVQQAVPSAAEAATVAAAEAATAAAAAATAAALHRGASRSRLASIQSLAGAAAAAMPALFELTASVADAAAREGVAVTGSTPIASLFSGAVLHTGTRSDAQKLLQQLQGNQLVSRAWLSRPLQLVAPLSATAGPGGNSTILSTAAPSPVEGVSDADSAAEAELPANNLQGASGLDEVAAGDNGSTAASGSRMATGLSSRIFSSNLTGAGVLICLVDTGINMRLPMFGGCTAINKPEGFCKVVAGHDFVGQQYDGSSTGVPPTAGGEPSDFNCNPHGSMVASVAATGNGVAPGAVLGAYKVFGCGGSTTDAVVVAAVDRAVRDGCDIINLSIAGGTGYEEGSVYHTAMRGATAAGAIVVKAAGNSGEAGPFSADVTTVTGAISVGSVGAGDQTVDEQLVVSPFSSWGPSPSLGLSPTVCAPGNNIKAMDPTGHEVTTMGTSFAAPFTSGVLALWLQHQQLQEQQQPPPQEQSQDQQQQKPRQPRRRRQHRQQQPRPWPGQDGEQDGEKDTGITFVSASQVAPPPDATAGQPGSQAAAHAPALSRHAEVLRQLLATARPVKDANRPGWLEPAARCGSGVIQADGLLLNKLRLEPSVIQLPSGLPHGTEHTVTITATWQGDLAATATAAEPPAAGATATVGAAAAKLPGRDGLLAGARQAAAQQVKEAATTSSSSRRRLKLAGADVAGGSLELAAAALAAASQPATPSAVAAAAAAPPPLLYNVFHDAAASVPLANGWYGTDTALKKVYIAAEVTLSKTWLAFGATDDDAGDADAPAPKQGVPRVLAADGSGKPPGEDAGSGGGFLGVMDGSNLRVDTLQVTFRLPEALTRHPLLYSGIIRFEPVDPPMPPAEQQEQEQEQQQEQEQEQEQEQQQPRPADPPGRSFGFGGFGGSRAQPPPAAPSLPGGSSGNVGSTSTSIATASPTPNPSSSSSSGSSSGFQRRPTLIIPYQGYSQPYSSIRVLARPDKALQSLPLAAAPGGRIFANASELREKENALCYTPGNGVSGTGTAVMDASLEAPADCDGGFSNADTTTLMVSLAALRADAGGCALRVTLAPEVPMHRLLVSLHDAAGALLGSLDPINTSGSGDSKVPAPGVVPTFCLRWDGSYTAAASGERATVAVGGIYRLAAAVEGPLAAADAALGGTPRLSTVRIRGRFAILE